LVRHKDKYSRDRKLSVRNRAVREEFNVYKELDREINSPK